MNILVSNLFILIFTVTLNEGKNYERIVFLDASATIHDSPEKEVPLSLIRQLNEVSNEEEFFKNLLESVDLKTNDFASDLTHRIDSRNGGFSAAAAKMAKCMPELQTVSLNPDKSSATFYYPSCTRIERCGGCCSHHLLSCQPVESKTKSISVVVADYLGGSKLQFKGKRVIEIEQHTRCRCECKIRPESCTRYQTYNRDKCHCECNNFEEEKRCGSDRSKKLWNADTCSCMCREEFDCSSGYYFDPFTCTCKLYHLRKNFFIKYALQ